MGHQVLAVDRETAVQLSNKKEVQLRLVPFGATNLRIAVFPWVRGDAGAPAAAR